MVGVVTTLSPTTLSSDKGIHTSVPMVYLLYWDGTVTVVGIPLRQYPLFLDRDGGTMWVQSNPVPILGPLFPSF